MKRCDISWMRFLFALAAAVLGAVLALLYSWTVGLPVDFAKLAGYVLAPCAVVMLSGGMAGARCRKVWLSRLGWIFGFLLGAFAGAFHVWIVVSGLVSGQISLDLDGHAIAWLDNGLGFVVALLVRALAALLMVGLAIVSAVGIMKPEKLAAQTQA